MTLENIGVAVFGAFIGGEFLADKFTVAATAGAFPVKAAGFAIAGALVMLVCLNLLRGAVGPVQPRKPKPKTRY